MDKKNTVLGLILFGAAFAMMYWQGKQFDTIDIEGDEPIVEVVDHERDAIKPEAIALSSGGGLFEVVRPDAPVTEVKAVRGVAETLYELENEKILVKFTTRGGGIKEVVMKDFPLEVESEALYVFNSISDESALGLGFKTHLGYQEFSPNYRVVAQGEDRIVMESVTREGVKVVRGYQIQKGEAKGDPYVIRHETRFVNNSGETFNLKNLLVSMGSFQPTKGDTFGEYLNVGYYDGEDDEFIKIGKFTGSRGFLGMGKSDEVDVIERRVPNMVWGSVKNQFFASVVTPDEAGAGVYTRRIPLMDVEDGEMTDGLAGSIEMALGQIQPKEERLLNLEFYIGPKEYKRLEALGKDQDLVMQFGFFGMISKLLLVVMTWVNGFVPNWGLTIIVVTILIKLLLWPLTAVQVRSAKRMAKIQEPMKALKEKYADNKQKMQMETMKLFKAHRVNPAAGCLPLFVQLPIFLGLYFMLRTASELRFADFLWIKDLSVPDTVMYVAGFPLNILPLMMGASMFVQMRVTPTPMTDNMQKKLFQMMPFVFLIFCYNFPSGLVLYWTVQNLLTILQQQITNRMKDPMDNMPVVVPAGDKKGGKKKAKGQKKR